jgi:hypothetical protein
VQQCHKEVLAQQEQEQQQQHQERMEPEE